MQGPGASEPHLPEWGTLIQVFPVGPFSSLVLLNSAAHHSLVLLNTTPASFSPDIFLFSFLVLGIHTPGLLHALNH